MALKPKIAVVDRTETAKGHAHDYGVHRWNSLDFLGKAVFGAMFRDSQTQHYTGGAMEVMVAEQEPLRYAVSPDRRKEAREAALARTLAGDPDTFRTDERWQDLSVDSPMAADAFKRPIREYVNDGRSDDWVREEEAEVLARQYGDRAKELAEPGWVGADNTREIAELLKDKARGEDANRMLDDMEVVASRDVSGVLPDPHRNWFDKKIESVRGSKLGSAFQPEVIVPLATIALVSTVTYLSSKAAEYSGKVAAIKSAVSLSPSFMRAAYGVISRPSLIPAVLMTAIPAAAGGVWMGFRENRHIKEDRAQVMRDLAQGKTAMDKDARRRQLETTGYSTAPASELTDALMERIDSDKLAEIDGPGQALEKLGEAIARTQMFDQQGIYSISYSSPGATIEERWKLDEAIARAKMELRWRLTPDVLDRLGVDRATDFDTLLEGRIERATDVLNEDIAAKDRVFKGIKRRAVASVIIQGAVFGLLTALVIQEADAAFDSKTGLVEQLWHGGSAQGDDVRQQTLLDAIFHGNRHATETHATTLADSHIDKKTIFLGHEYHEARGSEHIDASSTYADYHIGEHGAGTLTISSDHSVKVNPDGTINLVAADGDVTIEHLSVNPDGSFPEESLDILHQHGMVVKDETQHIVDIKPTPKTVSVDRYMELNNDDTLRVQREGWLLNNTSDCCDSDGNELSLGWGGADGKGVVDENTVQMSFGSATPDGSFQGDIAVNPLQSAKDGNLVLLVTPTHDWQNAPIPVSVNPNMTIDVAPDSPAAPFFEVGADGHAQINADFVEIAHKTGQDDQGVTHVYILATAAGTHNDGCLDTVHQPPIEKVTYIQNVRHESVVPSYRVTTDGYDEPVTNIVQGDAINVQVPVPKFIFTQGSETTSIKAAVLPAIVLPLARRTSLRPALPPAAAPIPVPVAPAVVSTGAAGARPITTAPDRPAPPRVVRRVTVNRREPRRKLAIVPDKEALEPVAIVPAPVRAIVPVDDSGPADGGAVFVPIEEEKRPKTPDVIALGPPAQQIRREEEKKSKAVPLINFYRQERTGERLSSAHTGSLVKRVFTDDGDKRRKWAIGAAAVGLLFGVMVGANEERKRRSSR